VICVGATVPGGAPALFSLSVKASAKPTQLGSTMPGAAIPTTALVSEDNSTLRETTASSPATPPRASLSKSVIDKPPMPQPRLSTIGSPKDSQSPVMALSVDQSNSLFNDSSLSVASGHDLTQSSSHIDLTTVTDLSEENSIFLKESPISKDTPQLSTPSNEKNSSLDSSVLDISIPEDNP